MNQNAERILSISKHLGLAHIGSCLSVLTILEEIYDNKEPKDKVLLDNAHAHLAHLVVRYPETAESMVRKDNYFIEQSIKENGIHCDRKAGCDASGGSLGHALGIAIGMSITNPQSMIHVIVSDGSIMEGSNWEALRLINDLKLYNIIIYCNFNGYTAVSAYNSDLIEKRMLSFTKQVKFYHTTNGEGFNSIEGHYKKL